ncbi:hypothetical protein [Micromonospora sediminicola]
MPTPNMDPAPTPPRWPADLIDALCREISGGPKDARHPIILSAPPRR